MTIWIVCQEQDGQKPVKVSAFNDKGAAAQDIASRVSSAPAGVWFWLESVEMATA